MNIKLRNLGKYVLAPIVLGFACSSLYASEIRSLECENTFKSDISHQDLKRMFGSQNVSIEEVNIGEGEMETATVLFAKTPEERVEIFWKDIESQKKPRLVQIHRLIRRGLSSYLGDTASDWKSTSGVTLGTDLKTLERINRFPFRIAGFEWDGSGGVISWGKGSLARNERDCELYAQLTPDKEAYESKLSWYVQVIGAREFSSAHLAMQNLNPTVFLLGLRY